MADPNQKPQSDQRAAQPAQQQPAPAEKREYTVKHKIVMGGRDNRRRVDPSKSPTIRLTEEEAARLGDAVELKR